MAIILPASARAQWTTHEMHSGSHASIEVPPQTHIKLSIALPCADDQHISVAVGEEASCELLTVQEGATGTVRMEGRVGRGATLHWRPVTIGGTVRHEILSRAIGDGATSAASWIVVAREGEHPQAVMRNMFENRQGTGEVAMRAVALAHGRVLLDGRIDIGEQGGGTQTYLTQEALMLDSSAKVDAIPGLEIKTNDVKASHSATVSRVNPEDLFYAASRGIEPHSARRLLVEGFLGKLLEGVDDEILRADLLARVIAAVSSVYSSPSSCA